MAHLDDLVVGHQLAGPLDDADADEQQREARGSGRGRRWRRRGRRWCRGRSPMSKRSRRRRTGRRTPRTGRTASRPGARRASRRARSTSVGRDWCGGQAGVGDRVGDDGVARVVAARPLRAVARRLVGAHASTFSLFERALWAAIQTAKPTSDADADEPGEHALAHRAEAAHAEAAVVGVLLDALEVGDDVALLLGREVAVGEASASACGPVSMRLVDVLAARRRGSAGRSRRGAWRRRSRRSCGRRCSWSGRSGRRGRSPPRAPRRSCPRGCSRTRRGSPGRGRARRRTPRARRSPRRCRRPPSAAPAGRAGAIGIRPVPTWKSTAAAPTPTSDGPNWLPSLGADALAVLAVAERAADQEQLAALGHQLLVGLACSCAWAGAKAV